MAIPVKEKNVKLKVKRDFYDKTNSLKLKKAGKELTVSPDRASATFFSSYIVKRRLLYYNTYICENWGDCFGR